MADDDGSRERDRLFCGGICYIGRRVVTGMAQWILDGVARFHDIRVYRKEAFNRSVLQREIGSAVVTVSNHSSVIDDPFIISQLVPFTDMQAQRWGWCASEVCWKLRSSLIDFVLETGKVIPINRGQGIHQPGFQKALGHLRRGDWFHVFPEGRVGYPHCWPSNSIGPLRQGVGRLVWDTYRDTGKAPPVLPFVHRGMAVNLQKQDEKYVLPRPRVPIRILIGDPIRIEDVFDDNTLRNPEDDTKSAKEKYYRDITRHIEDALLSLQVDMDKIIEQEEGRATMPSDHDR